jgi:peptidoglycan/xylan/chitin deacetylase (PgdA/CDA1 family)
MIAGKRRIAARALDRIPRRGRTLLERRWNGVLILNYHRVGDASAHDGDHAMWSATAEAFDQQLAVIARHADVIGPEDLEGVLDSRGRAVMLTFDDGYRDNFEIAYPLLRAHGLTATFFLTTGFIDEPRPAWWDELAWMVRHGTNPPADPTPVIRQLTERYKALPASETAAFLRRVADETGAGPAPAGLGAEDWMTWDMARELRDAGMAVGGHTADHPILARLSPQDQEDEIRRCARRLRDELGEPMRWFAYPVGSRDAFTPDTARILREYGTRAAFSFYGGHQPAGRWNPMDVPRVHVGPSLDAPMLRAMLSVPRLFAGAA